MKLLFVQKTHELPSNISAFLEKEGCQVDKLSLTKSSEKISNTEYDCIILLIGNNFEKYVHIIEQLNNKNRTDGLIIISENDSLELMINCFDLGIDDFLVYPFQIPALFARLKAVVRRRKFNTKRKLYFSNLTIDFHLKKIYVMGKEVNFTLMEYEIILYLFANENQPKTGKSLVQYLWSDSPNNIKLNNVLFTHIKNIRVKLKESKAKIVIKNNYGVGYQIEEL